MKKLFSKFIIQFSLFALIAANLAFAESIGYTPNLNYSVGSIAAQDASAVAITGGAIDGTTIGGTTPAAGTFTTATTTGLGKFVGTESVGTTFTITSGCGSGGTAPTSLTGGAATGSFVANATACAPLIALPTAAHGWWCSATDLTHTADLFVQTATAAASCTLSATVTAGDTIVFHAEAY